MILACNSQQGLIDDNEETTKAALHATFDDLFSFATQNIDYFV
jgi:hypothetical protein